MLEIVIGAQVKVVNVTDDYRGRVIANYRLRPDGTAVWPVRRTGSTDIAWYPAKDLMIYTNRAANAADNAARTAVRKAVEITATDPAAVVVGALLMESQRLAAQATLELCGRRAVFPALIDRHGAPVQAILTTNRKGQVRWGFASKRADLAGKITRWVRDTPAALAAAGYRRGTVLAPATVVITGTGIADVKTSYERTGTGDQFVLVLENGDPIPDPS